MAKKNARKATARAPSKAFAPKAKALVKKMRLIDNREQWLNRANSFLVKWFDDIGYPLSGKKIRISCGWPGGRGAKKAIGQCWDPRASKDGTIEIFISPTQDDPLRVLDILVHENVHAAVGNKEGHKGAFAIAARLIGLEGKLTATHAGEFLLMRLKVLLKKLPPYPHASLDHTQSPIKKQTTKLLKAQCKTCGYTYRITAKWVREAWPVCPQHGKMTVEGINV